MIEERLRDIIVDQYGSMNEFAKATGIKYQTLVSILNRGVQNATVHNVITICQQLGISADALAEGRIAPAGSGRSKELRAMLHQFTAPGWHKGVVIDGLPLSKEEGELFAYGVEALYDTLRKRRGEL